ncbi:hypothetical protein ESCAB7627_2405 [Escherichia albertii TW07627]|uniref:Uncharacterized protein n=1 Tax=Escherichia albertii (strain TW07627) TaxID=502347 RepID=A0ABC9NP81_ESCAT|nr:hypothetical protein ESCAB7627_2405 [Escherichia albertii TW07627]
MAAFFTGVLINVILLDMKRSHLVCSFACRNGKMAMYAAAKRFFA